LWPPEDIWNNPDALRDYYATHAVPLRPSPGVLVVSIVVSILGSYTTLLCLGRRTSSKGWKNHFLLMMAGVCFACVAVWGMHFVSMISIHLRATPHVTWYITFSKGFTALSLFVPLIATLGAFWVVGGVEFNISRVVVAGIFSGLTIGLMHYSASFHLPYLMVSYTAVTVAFALILACIASTAALVAFFRLRSQWEDSFWKRGICALFLASAVTRLTIFISVMCGVIIILTAIISMFDYYVRRGVREKARHVIVCSTAFDTLGRLLVKNDGTLPLQLIETDVDLKKLVLELDPRQGTFQWLYQLSFVWHTITPFLSEILRSIAKRRLGAGADLIDLSIPAAQRESLIFRRRFIEAAVLMAQSLDISVESLGFMLDRVLTTGQKANEDKFKSAFGEEEKAVPGLSIKYQGSEGVLLFLVREIGDAPPFSIDSKGGDKSFSTDNVDHYMQRGYRMADTHFFSKALADNLGVLKGEMDLFLSACKTYAKRGTKPVVQPGGIYASIFGVRPTLDHQGDMVVYNFARHQIPAYRLPDVNYPMSNRMAEWLHENRGIRMGELLYRCNADIQYMETHDSGPGSIQTAEDEALYEFLTSLIVALEALSKGLRQWCDIGNIASFLPEVVKVPTSDTDDTMPSQLIIMHGILPAPNGQLTPIHSRLSGVQVPDLESGRDHTDKPPAPFVYSPYTLFAKAQSMVMRDDSYVAFSQSIVDELRNIYP
ncbi:hypothetical protein TREMEDRAFT_12207, partial [Tremella mesenterica DSM 1558]|uniref:uncharacterized protein n=1 Tax=Tremella mesenterica (strain ATCC 24925 / CBS 8224 / DSM 1558 / NBRC 9311 / NRRL Y-6157 / RJB 2259-6 / UBC 559-6) TaxID=578456 RepID=UPI0003F48E9B